MRRRRKTTHVVVHCSALPYGTAHGIRNYHMKDRGWADIGYHYVIGNGVVGREADYDETVDGRVWIGRAEGLVGAHAVGLNSVSVGVCLVGVDRFTVKQMEMLIRLAADLRRRYGVPVENVLGHRELVSGARQGKTCPGFDVAGLRRLLEVIE